ncbi:MAG: peptidoglycan DD-metalloendopeptidase family protein [Deltaproteobacteria bacterium]|jgi:septal ring factor EnvC (AmiA/AmiB activator)|nr:peptidoglycan DD-metalloendopeptidase family protein [Deltaproteobacteria bacterium]
MEILRDIFKGYIITHLRVFLFSAAIIYFFIPPSLLGFWNRDLYAYTQKTQPPITLHESFPKKLKIEQEQGSAEKNIQLQRLQLPPPQELTKKQQQQIIEKNTRIRKLQEGIIDHKIKILGSRKKEKTLLGELEKIENELQVQKNMLITLRQESERQELLLSDKQEYLSQVLAAKRKHQVIVKKRLAAYYRMGSVGLMNVVFSTESLPELLDFKEYFNRMVQHDHAIIQKYLSELKESNRAREEHAREKLRLMKLADDVREKEEQLTRIRQEKNLLLKRVNTEQQLYEQAVSEIEEAVADLAVTLQKIQTAAQSQTVSAKSAGKTETDKNSLTTEPSTAQEGFVAQKGLLNPPVMGTVISLFGQQMKGKFDSATIINGIDIRVSKDVEIKAVFEGRIIHAGYLRGYGNLMIIDHGEQYFSLISRAADFYKKEGSRVLTGEVIGLTGEGDPLYGEGLHFEIRRGANPEDPLLWLKKKALPIEAVKAGIQ